MKWRLRYYQHVPTTSRGLHTNKDASTSHNSHLLGVSFNRAFGFVIPSLELASCRNQILVHIFPGCSGHSVGGAPYCPMFSQGNSFHIEIIAMGENVFVLGAAQPKRIPETFR